jgi:hypothetical protein
MKKKIGFYASGVLLGLMMVTLSFLDACKSPYPSISIADEAAIYTAVVRWIYEQDDTYGGTLNPPLVYLVRATDDSIGDPEVDKKASNIIAEPVAAEILIKLRDLPAEIIWVDNHKDVPLDPDSGQVPGDGVIITLGNLHPQRDGSLHISGSIYIASLAAGGKTYIVKQVEGLWQVTGTTGVQWIS